MDTWCVAGGHLADVLQDVPHGLPHLCPARIVVPLRVTNQCGIGPERESVKHDATGRSHLALNLEHGLIELIERRLDQQCIVHGGADTDPVFGGEAARYP